MPARLPAGTRVLVLEAQRLISIDASGVDALTQLYRTLQRQGVGLQLCELNEQPRSLLQRSGFSALIGEERIAPTLAEALARSVAPTAT